jgi:hypothetical protein
MIAVPSRGRSGKSATLEALRGRADVVIVAPVDDVEAYESAYDDFLVVPQTGKGIGGARQDILDFARAHDTGPYWMLDDDITAVFERDGVRFHKIHIDTALAFMEQQIAYVDAQLLALAGPQFRHRAWTGDDVERDKHLRNFVRVNPAAPIEYWPWLKEDLDVVLQSLLAGWHTLRFNSIAFESPQMGSTPGGCQPDYAAGLLDEACQRLAGKYPGIVKVKLNMTTGAIESPVDWREVRRRQAVLA